MNRNQKIMYLYPMPWGNLFAKNWVILISAYIRYWKNPESVQNPGLWGSREATNCSTRTFLFYRFRHNNTFTKSDKKIEPFSNLNFS